MRELVTIQVGEFANYIGSHYWNFQDELLGLAGGPQGDPIYSSSSLNFDVLYRSGETSQGIPTYCPRLISVGYKGTLGFLSCSGSSSPQISDPDSFGIVNWPGNVIRYTAEPREKNIFLQSLCGDENANQTPNSSQENDHFQRQITDKDRIECLENGVRYWTDFSKVQYHPRSMYELHGLWTDVEKIDNFGIGEDIISNGLHSEEMNERLRFFMEECDHIQGIQFIVDDSGGFSAIAASFLEDIADEYSNTPVLLYSARSPASYAPGKSSRESASRALHDAVSFSRLSSCCKLMIPVGLPSLSRSKLSSTLFVEDQKLFHCSAIYAASLHSLSIPFRMEPQGVTAESMYISGAVDVGGMVQMLAGQARQNIVAIMDLAMPAPSLAGEIKRETSILGSLCSLTPEIEENCNDMHSVESLIVHGALSGGRRVSISEVEQHATTSYQNEIQRPAFCHLSAAMCPLPIPLPFPTIFRNHVGREGELSNAQHSEERRGPLEVDSVPLAVRLRSSSAVKPLIERRLGSLYRYGLQRGSPGVELLRCWGFGREEVEDMAETLAKMVRSLDSNAYSSSDSDY